MSDEPRRILLVEDNSADVYLMRKALAGAGLNVELTVISDGGSALDFVRREGECGGGMIPDLAVIDLNLPKADGVQVIEALRAAERFAAMPVIVMSSSVQSPRLDHLRIARYIPKPPDLEEFLRTGFVIKELLDRLR